MPVWRNPAAWFGLAALAIPIVVHLLARMRARVIAFPSLRFIDASRLAARKRRTLSDLPLLALRLLALLLAIAACANPLFLTASRRAAWATRVSRAVVIDTSPSMSRAGATKDDVERIADRETHDTLRSTTIRSASLPDAVARAIAWLRTAPPSRREIVLVSDFQEGTLTAALLRDVPDDVGLRFIRVGTLPREATADARPVSTRGPNTPSGTGGFTWMRAQVHVDLESTAITGRAPVTLPPIAIAADGNGFTLSPFSLRVTVPTSADRAIVRAASEAVLAEGVPAPVVGQDRRVELVIAGASTPAAVGPVSVPWMAKLMQRVADDRALTVARAESSTSAAPGTSTPAEPVVLADAGGAPLLLAAARAGALVLTARTPANAPVTPLLIRGVLRALGEPDTLPAAEVRAIPDSALRAWTRPATEPSIEAMRQVEDSDRRWFWASALAILIVETWLRRDRYRQRTGAGPVEVHEHAA